MIDLKFKKLNPDAVLPSYAKEGDAGLDLTAISYDHQPKLDLDFSSSRYQGEGYEFDEYGTGLAVEIPEGYVGLIFPRSSISNTSLILANCVGVVDSAYRGEIKCRFKNTNIRHGKVYSIGERIAQLIVLPYPKMNVLEVNELSETERGEGGFGSTNVQR